MNNSWATRGNSCFFSTYNYHIITHEFIINYFITTLRPLFT
jgi:hypothetical protein